MNTEIFRQNGNDKTSFQDERVGIKPKSFPSEMQDEIFLYD